MKHVEIALGGLVGAGLSQMEIARRVGMTQTRVHRWVSGDVPAAANDAIRIVELAKALGVMHEQSATLPKPEEDHHEH